MSQKAAEKMKLNIGTMRCPEFTFSPLIQLHGKQAYGRVPAIPAHGLRLKTTEKII